MVDRVINALIAGVVGAAAFIAVGSIVQGNMYDGPISHHTWNASNGLYDFGTNNTFSNLPYNSSNASASELLIHDITPLAVAILVVAALFMGLTHVRGI